MVVVTLNVENYELCRILIDNGSFADVLYYDAFLKVGISLDWLIQVSFPLVGFVGDAI